MITIFENLIMLEPVPSFLSIDFIEGGGKKRGI